MTTRVRVLYTAALIASGPFGVLAQDAERQMHIELAQAVGPVQSSHALSVERLLAIMNERDKLYRDTINALEKSINAKFDAQEKAVLSALIAAKEAVNAALTASKEAVNKAETASDKRFESVNEFRKTLADQASHFAPRTEMDIRFRTIEESFKTRTVFVDENLAQLNSRLNVIQGQGEGAKLLWGIAATLIGLVLGLGAFLFKKQPAPVDSSIAPAWYRELRDHRDDRPPR